MTRSTTDIKAFQNDRKYTHYDVFDPRSIDKNGKADPEQSNFMFNFSTDLEGKIQGIGIFPDGSEKPMVFEKSKS